MIKRIELVNFMAHAQTVIEPADGLTVLVGPNNCGKSAAVAALQALCENPRGDYMVRHGEKECRVTVETREGDVLTWKRIKDTVSYTINGEEIHRLRGAVPENLHAKLRLGPVESADRSQSFDVHFGEQKSPLFLLNESGAKAATFFASSGDTVLLIQMQRLHKQQETESRQQEKRLTKEIEGLETELAELTPLDELQQRVKGLGKEYSALMREAQEIEEISERCTEIAAQGDRVAESQSRSQALATLPGIPQVQDISLLAALVKDLGHATRNIGLCKEETAALGALSRPPDLADAEALSATVKLLARLHRGLREAEAVHAHVADLPLPPVLAETDKLQRLVHDLESAKRKCRRSSEAYTQAEEAFIRGKEEVQAWASENRFCPTCGARLDAEQVLSLASHIHGNHEHE